VTAAPGAAARSWRERLDSYLARHQDQIGDVRVVPLTGDASDRKYFRLVPPGAEATRVVAVHAEPFEFETLAFAQVAQLLRRMPIPVPAILDHHDALGVLMLEDLGDVTLQARLGGVGPDAQRELYRQAVELIVFLQRRGQELADPASRPYRIAFDVEKLMWELDFFVNHFIVAYRGAVLPAATRRALRAECLALAEELAAEPPVLCHRDYHSRNLMWHRERLYVIDFQDARMGPDTYDLVSLLRDSYVDLGDRLVDEMIERFLDGSGRAGKASEFRRRFEVMALQRNLKALGTFGYQTTTRSNPVYIQYIPRTLRYARDTLARLDRFGRLREILVPLLTELG
jgi:hypothetical protein